MFLTDVRHGFTFFFTNFLSIFSSCIDILKSFSFGSFNLFDIILSLMIIPVGLSLCIATMKGARLYVYRERRSRR